MLEEEHTGGQSTDDSLRGAQPSRGQETEKHSASLSNIRHQLRTPLNHIIGYSEMLLEEAEDQQLESFAGDLNKIHSAGKQLLAMINDLIDPAIFSSRPETVCLENIGDPGSFP